MAKSEKLLDLASQLQAGQKILANSELFARASKQETNLVDFDAKMEEIRKIFSQGRDIFEKKLEPHFQPIKSAIENLYAEYNKVRKNILKKQADFSDKAESEKEKGNNTPEDFDLDKETKAEEDAMIGKGRARQQFEKIIYNSGKLQVLLGEEITKARQLTKLIHRLAFDAIRESGEIKLRDPANLTAQMTVSEGGGGKSGADHPIEMSVLGKQCLTPCGPQHQGTAFDWCAVEADESMKRKFSVDPSFSDHKLYFENGSVSTDRYWDYCVPTIRRQQLAATATTGSLGSDSSARDSVPSVHRPGTCLDESELKQAYRDLVQNKYLNHPNKYLKQPGSKLLDLRRVPKRDQYSVQLLLSRFDKDRLQKDEQLRQFGTDAPAICQPVPVIASQEAGQNGSSDYQWPVCVVRQSPSSVGSWQKHYSWDFCVPKANPPGAVETGFKM
ncbi:unnamed protein product [Amoebophrya sp. A120]|nr:unnamed protein product [Amoebophrya sp. A120]|eukprot:GSA120T00012032001.1